MNKNGSGAFRKPESYSLVTDLTPNPTNADGAEPPVKSLVSTDVPAPDVSLAPTAEQQDVATAHPVGEILVAPAEPDAARVVPRRRLRPHIRKPRMRPMRVHTFDSLLHRDYRFLWASTLFFSGAFWMQQVIIGWLTYELTQSALLTSLAMGLDALPILIAGPLGGLLVDRWDKRKLLAGVFAYQSLLALGFGGLVLLSDVNAWHIFSFIFLMGIGWVIVDPARMALIPSIVPHHNMVNAFALNSLAFSITRLAIPAVGGRVARIRRRGFGVDAARRPGRDRGGACAGAQRIRPGEQVEPQAERRVRADT